MILVLGSSGYVGSAFMEHLEYKTKYIYKGISRSELNYYDTQTLIDYIRKYQVSFIINCAGYTGKPNVDACEEEMRECLRGNVTLPQIIAEACAYTHIKWGHVSSGCIYTGKNEFDLGFDECEDPNFTFKQDNCSFYSGTKALGEDILRPYFNCYIWRLRIPFNNVNSPRNYITKLMTYNKLLKAENSISNLDDFVWACVECWARDVPTGIYNVVNTGSVTTEQVIEQIEKVFDRKLNVSYFDSEEEFMQIAAKAPRSNCVLSNDKLTRTGIVMPSVKDALQKSLENWTSQ